MYKACKMKNILKIGYRNFLFIVFITFCIQFTELKLGVVKISEILLLLLTPFIYQRKMNRWIYRLFLFISLWFLISLCFNPFRDFYLLQKVSKLKTPYFISFGRFLELFACLNLAAIIINFLKNKELIVVNKVIKAIVLLNLWITIFHLYWYFLFMTNFIDETYFVYGRIPRLRGWYVEAGPYGLMLSFVFCLTFFYNFKYNALIRVIFAFTIIFAAKSKAGTMFILIWYLTYYFKIIYKTAKEYSFIFILLGILISGFILYEISYQYVYQIENVRREMKERPTDVNLVMGRIAGLFIFPDMLIDNPIFGIGLGNYPLIRNNPEYLGFVPKSPPGKTDAHGFGGLLQILVDGGVFIFSLFVLLMVKIYKKTRVINHLKYFLFAFLYLFIFGVQIYFLYPWVLFGFLIATLNSYEVSSKDFGN